MATLAFLEKLLAYLQGKGYGAATMAREVRHALALLDGAPTTVLDIGANRGLWTAQLLSHHPETTVHAFEPQPICYTGLHEKYAGLPNVHLHNNAVSNTSGVFKLYFDHAGSGLASLSKRELGHLGVEFENSVDVTTVVLDDFLTAAQIGRIDILKLDVEGHEMAAFQGMKHTLDGPTPPRVIQFEFGGCNIDTRTFFRDFYLRFDERYMIYRQTPFGLSRLKRYVEADECFRTTNYFLKLKKSTTPAHRL
jgi:FkbM family methyltransferase